MSANRSLFILDPIFFFTYFVGVTLNSNFLFLSKFKQTEGFLVKYTYFSVAYKIIGEKYIVKTIYID